VVRTGYLLHLLQPQIQYCYGCTTDLLPAAEKLHHPKLTEYLLTGIWNSQCYDNSNSTWCAVQNTKYQSYRQTVCLHSCFWYWDDIRSSTNLCLCEMWPEGHNFGFNQDDGDPLTWPYRLSYTWFEISRKYVTSSGSVVGERCWCFGGMLVPVNKIICYIPETVIFRNEHERN
jgi:hypothetical protein